MKKLLLLFIISLIFVSCKPEHKVEEKIKTWTILVHYINDTTDTLVVQGYNRPKIMIHDGVSIIDNGEFNIEPVASYVKSFKILEEK